MDVSGGYSGGLDAPIGRSPFWMRPFWDSGPTSTSCIRKVRDCFSSCDAMGRYKHK